MMALSSFRKQSGSASSFAAWLKRTHPLTSLKSMRAILDLDQLDERRRSARDRSSAKGTSFETGTDQWHGTRFS